VQTQPARPIARYGRRGRGFEVLPPPTSPVLPKDRRCVEDTEHPGICRSVCPKWDKSGAQNSVHRLIGLNRTVWTEIENNEAFI
jgi:hypothetical protein